MARYDTSTLQFNYFVWPETTITLTSQDSFTVLAHGGPGTVLENLSTPYGTTSEYVRVDGNNAGADYSYTITEAFDGDWNSLGVNVCIEGWDAGGQLGYTPYSNPGRCPSAYTTNFVCNWTELGVEGTTYLPTQLFWVITQLMHARAFTVAPYNSSSVLTALSSAICLTFF